MADNFFDEKVSKITRKSAKGQLGIELEAESVDGFHFFDNDMNANGLKWWTQKAEGSLRQGIEMATREPILLKDVPAAMAEYEKYLKGTTFSPSIRTSTHIHVNQSDSTFREVYSRIMAWWLVESLLVRTQGVNRNGNLYCLRFEDAEGIFDLLLRDLKNRKFLMSFNNNVRYAAQNLSAVWKFGSLEYRFLRFPHDFMEVHEWCQRLLEFNDRSSKLSWTELCRLTESPADTILSTLLGTETKDYLRHQLPTEDFEWLTHQHSDRIYMLTNSLLEVDKEYQTYGDEDEIGATSDTLDAIHWERDDDEEFFEEDDFPDEPDAPAAPDEPNPDAPEPLQQLRQPVVFNAGQFIWNNAPVEANPQDVVREQDWNRIWNEQLARGNR